MTGITAFLTVSLVAFLVGKQHAREITDPSSRSSVILFSQLYQQQVAKNVRLRYLDPLLEKAHVDTDFVSAEALTDGFCNNVYRISIQDGEHQQPKRTLVAKIFSDLAKKRIDPSQPMGDIDNLLDRERLGPHIIAQTPDALLMEHIDGTVLDESMLFAGHNVTLSSKVGDALGRMHSLEIPGKMHTTSRGTPTSKRSSHQGGPNMLWHAMDVMLSSIGDQTQVTTNNGKVWTLPKLQDTVHECRNYLETKHLPCVAVGHGDFKLSNVMVEHATGNVRFIDFELSGAQYRGYDLAKFFRGHPSSDDNIHQQAFWASYHRRLSTHATDETTLPTKLQPEIASQLEWEASLLEPMTWLEAVSFFLCMATSDDPSQKDRWMGMAQQRLSSYERLLQLVK